MKLQIKKTCQILKSHRIKFLLHYYAGLYKCGSMLKGICLPHQFISSCMKQPTMIQFVKVSPIFEGTWVGNGIIEMPRDALGYSCANSQFFQYKGM